MDLGHIEEHFHPKHGMSALKDSRARGQRPIKDQLASNWSSFDLQLIFNWSSIDLFPIDLKLFGNPFLTGLSGKRVLAFVIKAP